MAVFFIHSTNVEDETVTIADPLFSHLSKSLRTRAGDTLVLNDERGRRYHTTILQVTKHLIHAKILSIQESPSSSTPSITLAQALLKGEKMGWVIQKATELGVQTVAPLITERVIPRMSPTHAASYRERWLALPWKRRSKVSDGMYQPSFPFKYSRNFSSGKMKD
jgi:16S rRNA (uracil1498-N3)-methyltransferase